jgi:UDP-2,4-diacetamido-2,4,6-trideoxy-beta-L-altropyranose hydrolase
MKNILIRVDGSHTIGLGHIYRMKSLAEKLIALGFRVSFVTRPDTVGATILQKAEFEIFFQIEDDTLISSKIFQKLSPNLIVFDILSTNSKQLSELREMSTSPLLAFDDTGAGLKQADCVINALVFSWDQYKANACNATLYEGPTYLILQPLPSRRWEQKINLKRGNNIFLAFGGTDDHHVTQRMLEALNKIELNLNIFINLGPGTESDVIKETAITGSPHNIAVVHSEPDLFTRFLETDLVICGGGIMLFELAALGVPSAAIATERHEIYNIKYAANSGFTQALGWEGDMDFTNAAIEISNLLVENKTRRQMSRRGLETVDGGGLDRCAAIVSELAA